MEVEEILLNCEEKMMEAVENFENHLTSVRTGRANPNMLNHIEIDYYGAMTPINQVASISVVEGRTLVIKPYDINSLKDIERAINISELGLPPQNDGKVVRISVPQLTTETRQSYCKDVSKYAEEAKILVRNIRRDANDELKKDKTVPEDVQKSLLDDVQKLTDKYIENIDSISSNKEKEIMTI